MTSLETFLAEVEAYARVLTANTDLLKLLAIVRAQDEALEFYAQGPKGDYGERARQALHDANSIAEGKA